MVHSKDLVFIVYFPVHSVIFCLTRLNCLSALTDRVCLETLVKALNSYFRVASLMLKIHDEESYFEFLDISRPETKIKGTHALEMTQLLANPKVMHYR